MSKDKKKTGKCHFCKKALGADHYCHGCHVFICDECNTNIDRGWGTHTPEDHKLDEDSE
jgi:hypothetical protein